MKKSENSSSEEVAPKKQSKATHHPVEKVRSKYKIWRVLFLTVVALCVLSVGTLTAYAFYVSKRILPHTFVGGVAVGGLTETQADALIVKKESAFSQEHLTLSYNDKTWNIPASDLSLSFSNNNALEAAYARGKSGTIGNQIIDFTTSLFQTRAFDVALQPLPAAATQKLATEVLNSIETQPKEVTLSIKPGNVQIVPGVAGQKLEPAAFSRSLTTALTTNTTTIPLYLGVAQPQVTSSSASAAQALAKSILAHNWIVTANNQQLTISPQQLAQWLQVSATNDSQGNPTQLTLSLNTNAVNNALTDFAKTVNIAPTNAIFTTSSTGLAVSLADKPGLTLQVDATQQALSTAILGNSNTTTITAATVTTQAAIQASMSSSLQLIGTGTTNFSGSPASRVTNIRVGVNDINGKMVNDSTEFSTVAALAPIDEAHGYVPGLVIIGNTTVPEDGGGLCQVSTTLFRAVMNAGLPITERQNHSYEVSYYQRGVGPGLDATIYDPSPDFKWKNDTGSPIYIQALISGTNLTFNLYGKSDGRTATITGPTTLQTFPVSGSPIYTNTNTLPAGKVEMIDGPVEGANTTATYTVTRNGKVINTQVFNSHFQAMPAQYLVGTGN